MNPIHTRRTDRVIAKTCDEMVDMPYPSSFGVVRGLLVGV